MSIGRRWKALITVLVVTGVSATTIGFTFPEYDSVASGFLGNVLAEVAGLALGSAITIWLIEGPVLTELERQRGERRTVTLEELSILGANVREFLWETIELLEPFLPDDVKVELAAKKPSSPGEVLYLVARVRGAVHPEPRESWPRRHVSGGVVISKPSHPIPCQDRRLRSRFRSNGNCGPHAFGY